MDRLSDEVSTCDSPPPTTHTCAVPLNRRQDAVSLLEGAFRTRGTVLSLSKVLWLAAEAEVELHKDSACVEAQYYKLLAEKLRDLGWTKPLPDYLEGTVTDASWFQILQLKQWYRAALQACYVALVNVLKDTSRKDLDSMKAFKRLILGLVLFLSAAKEKIPSRFNQEKLERLEGEIVQILRTMHEKAVEKIVIFEEKGKAEVEVALKDGEARLKAKSKAGVSLQDCPQLSAAGTSASLGKRSYTHTDVEQSVTVPSKRQHS